MPQSVLLWLRHYGGLSLVAGGMALYVVTLVLEVVLGWRFSYPHDAEWKAVIIMAPAIGVAMLYLQSWDEADDDGHVAPYGGDQTTRSYTSQDQRKMR